MRHHCLMTEPVRPTTEEAIIQAAFDVLNRTPNASIADIASRAGVGRATLHRHFSSRDDLIRALCLRAIKELDGAAEEAVEQATSNADALRLILQAVIPLGNRYGFLASALDTGDQELNAHYERQMQETRDLIDAAKSEGALAQDAPTTWIAQAFDHLIYAGWESVYTKEATPSQAACLAWRTLTKGVGA